MPLIANTDQGAQFTSQEYVAVVKVTDIQISMDDRGRQVGIRLDRSWQYEQTGTSGQRLGFIAMRQYQLCQDRLVRLLFQGSHGGPALLTRSDIYGPLRSLSIQARRATVASLDDMTAVACWARSISENPEETEREWNNMKRSSVFTTVALLLAGSVASRADLVYSFTSELEGFQNVGWQSADPAGWSGSPGTVQQTHTAGGWQNLLTKEFTATSGGGVANQQLEMQALANLGDNARISFDVMVDGKSFPAGQSTWFQLIIVGNSDGAAGWTQKGDIFTASGWHSADDATLVSMHFDQPFSWLGWQPGDTWFQLWTGANSEGAVPVNFYFDNVKLSAVPEPSSLALLGFGAMALLLRRRN